MTDRFDVAVAGAGPAGATAALLFARRGYRVALLDQARFPRDKACAEYMSPGVWETLSRLDLGKTILYCRPLAVRGMDIVSPRSEVLRLQYGSGSHAPRALTLPRREFDAALVQAAAESGVDVIQSTRVRALRRDGEQVIGLDAATHGRSPRAIAARLVVIADGARSHLTRALGVARAPRWPVRLGLVAHYRGPAAWPSEFGQMYVARGGYCGVAPLPPVGGAEDTERLNVAMVVPLASVRQSGEPAGVFFDRWIDEHPWLRDLLSLYVREGAVRGVGPIGARSARVSVAGALVVGDAAGFFDPFTGEGIYRALRGAEMAAEIGDQALCSGDVSSRALHAYDRERMRVFSRKEAVTALVQAFVQYPRLLDYAVPRLKLRPEPLAALSLVLGDIAEAGRFLRPSMLWRALRP